MAIEVKEKTGTRDKDEKGERINDKMNRVPRNQLGFEFGPLAPALLQVGGVKKNLILDEQRV